MPGTLTVCATPIGNMEDISVRALRALKEADLIAAEDTRHTLGLLNHFDIHTPMVSCQKFNEAQRSQQLIDRILAGEHVVLVSDAGTPAISDPGEVLVAQCRSQGIEVTAIPGPCAFVTALSASGMPSRAFIFEGFLPPDSKERKEIVGRLQNETRTVIFYEAPHHLKTTLSFLFQALGDRKLMIARELTKVHEEYRLTTLVEAIAYYEVNDPRGEYVLILGGADKETVERERISSFETLSFTEHMKRYADLPPKEAMKKVALDRGMTRRDVYNALLAEKPQEIEET